MLHCVLLPSSYNRKSASLGPACGFPALLGQVVALLPTTTDAPSSGLIFRHFCHSVSSPLSLRIQTRMIPV